MVTTGNFVNLDALDPDQYDAVLDTDAIPVHGVFVSTAPASAKTVLEAFAAEGYSMGEALELRDLILEFNKKHLLVPTTL